MFSTLMSAVFLSVVAPEPAAAPGNGANDPAAAVQRLTDVPNTTVQHYDVEGTDAASINRSISRQRPSIGGRPVAAATNWTVNATFQRHSENGQCKVTGAEAKFAATADLPRLADEQKLDKATLARWRNYLAALEASEVTNLIYVFYHLDQVEKAISASNCDEAKAAGIAAVEQLKIKAAAFEREREQHARKAMQGFGDAPASTEQAANVICKNLVGSGSRLNNMRVCMTKREWAKLQLGGEQATREMQDQRRVNRPF